MKSKFLSPFVYWAQNDKQLTLKIDLKQVQVKNEIKFIIILK